MCGRLPWRSWPFLPALRRENPESDVQLCHGHGHIVVRKILQEQRLHAPYGCTRQLLQVTSPKAQFRRRSEMSETIEGHAHQVVEFVRVHEGWADPVVRAVPWQALARVTRAAGAGRRPGCCSNHRSTPIARDPAA